MDDGEPISTDLRSFAAKNDSHVSGISVLLCQAGVAGRAEIVYHHDACILMQPMRLDTMSSLQIRDMPNDLYQALSFRARREHRSLVQQAVVELRRIPALTTGERRKAVLARIRAALQQPDGALSPAPETLVREDREC